MSFLDDLISEQQFNPNVDQGILGQIENLIWHSSLDEREKARMIKKMLNLESVSDAMRMLEFLKDFQPIPGIHRTPITQYEIVQATRERVERENFKERSK